MALYSCAIYVSSGVASIASRVAAVASAASPSRIAVVDTFTDTAYARSSVKLVAEPSALLQAARAAVAEALELVDVREAPHPRSHRVRVHTAHDWSPSACSQLSTQPHPAPHPRCVRTPLWQPMGRAPHVCHPC